MRKTITALLLLSMLLSLAGCSGTADETLPEDTAADTAANTAADTEPVVADGLGEYDFAGDTFHIMTRYTPLFYPYHNVEETTGDVLNDAVYNRNRSLEERFNFLLAESYYDYSVEGNDHPRSFLLAGDTTYDMFVGRCVHMFNYAIEHMILPVEDIPLINTDQPYWNDQLYSDLTVGDTHYFAIGDFNVSAMDFTHVLLFNKGMMTDHNLGDPYEMVRSGEWTFSAFRKMVETVTADVNGDGVMDASDRYGYTSLVKQVLPAFWIAADVVTIGKDADNLLTFTAPTDEKLISVFQRIYEIIWDGGIWHRNVEEYAPATNDAELNMFKNGLTLFTNASCFQITTMMRDADVEFGILPYPKYDDAQDAYYSRIEGCELFGIPLSQTNTEMVGVLLEAMACASYHEVVPAYYDVALKVKYTRDNDSAQMLDIVFQNRVFDYGDTILADQLRDGVLRQKFEKDDRNVVSALTSVEGPVTSKLADINEGFTK